MFTIPSKVKITLISENGNTPEDLKNLLIKVQDDKCSKTINLFGKDYIVASFDVERKFKDFYVASPEFVEIFNLELVEIW